MATKLQIMSKLCCPGSHNPFKMDIIYLVALYAVGILLKMQNME